jgi:cobalt/nickel transport system permease protein
MAEQSHVQHRHTHSHRGAIENLFSALLGVLEHAQLAERLAARRGFLQQFDPRVRLVSLLALILFAVAVPDLPSLCGLFGLALLLAWASDLPLGLLARGIWPSVLFFSGLIALPAVFLVPGDNLARLPLLGWSISKQGAASAGLLLARALTTSTFAALLILSTPWPHLLKAMRGLGAPAMLVAILSMTYRYLFVLLQSAVDLLAARQSRLVGRLHRADQRRLLITGLGVLFGKSLQLANEVHLAMQSRGYRGEHRCLLEFNLRTRDWLALVLLAAALLAGGW